MSLLSHVLEYFVHSSKTALHLKLMKYEFHNKIML